MNKDEFCVHLTLAGWETGHRSIQDCWTKDGAAMYVYKHNANYYSTPHSAISRSLYYNNKDIIRIIYDVNE